MKSDQLSADVVVAAEKDGDLSEVEGKKKSDHVRFGEK